MKKILSGLCLSFIGFFAHSQNGLENIIVEKYYISNAADATGSVGALSTPSTTYRIYVDMLPGYKFQALYGVPGHTLKINTTTNFFNNEDYGATTPAFSKTNAAKNTVMLDSWFSVGGACNSNFGVVKSEDDGVANVVNVNGLLANNDPGAGIPLTTQDGFLAGTPESVTFVNLTTELDVFDGLSLVGNSFLTSNGSIASLNGSTGPTSSNKVLIGQFTTNGCFSFELNLQIGTPTGGVQNYVARDPVGSEILFPACVYNKAAVVISANPPGAVCSGTSITFTANPINGGASPSYQWKKNGTNVGTNSPTFSSTALTNGQLITCVMTSNASNLCTSGGVTSNVIAANISPLPDATVSIAGPTTYCSGTNLCTLTAPSGIGNLYQWIKGTANISGATNISYKPTATVSNTYKVKVTNSNGCIKTSTTTSITINPLPTATVTLTGPPSFCSGKNLDTLTANSGTGFSYQWRKSTTNISGATNIIYVPTTTNSSYNVKITDSNGCAKVSANTAITVNALPSATITPQGPTTFCAGDSVVLQANSGAGLIYQWIKGSSNISGATLDNYHAKTGGSYKVKVTNANGCSKTSAVTTVTVNCRGENFSVNGSGDQLSIFPNPANGVFNLKINNSSIEDGDATIEMTNAVGQNIFIGKGEFINGELNREITPGNDWAKGLYLIKISSKDVIFNGKIILQ